MYIDTTDTSNGRFALNAVSADSLTNARTINGMSFNGSANINNYGVCSTAAATAAKTVNVGSEFVLEEGATVRIKFTNANSASSPTLNVNGTGALGIKRYGTTSVGTSSVTGWNAGAVMTFTYDGTNWIREYFNYQDLLVTQYVTTTNAEYPLLSKYSTSTSSQTSYTRFATGVTLNPSTGNITATSFTGDLIGNADTTTKLIATKKLSISNTAGTTGTDFDGSEDVSLIIPDTLTGFTSITSTNFVGNASTATALTSSAGSSTVPIYFSSGKPIQCSTSLEVSITGNAATATKLATARTISLSGDVSGSASFNGSANITITTSVADNSHNHSYLAKRSNNTITSTTNDTVANWGAYSTSVHWYNTADYITNQPSQYGYILNIGYGSETQQLWFSAPGGGLYYRGGNSSGWSKSWTRIWMKGDSVTGAVWNDYAECRESDCEEPGYVLIENGDDTLSKSSERLQPFAGVSSDTWGFSQGETANARTHIAVAGRVLVYTYQDRNNYKSGDCVCAAPGGTVDIMTREEVINYPDRIVGTVSCVPNYEEWGGDKSADRDPVKINGRIWIKVV